MRIKELGNDTFQNNVNLWNYVNYYSKVKYANERKLLKIRQGQ